MHVRLFSGESRGAFLLCWQSCISIDHDRRPCVMATLNSNIFQTSSYYPCLPACVCNPNLNLDTDRLHNQASSPRLQPSAKLSTFGYQAQVGALTSLPSYILLYFVIGSQPWPMDVRWRGKSRTRFRKFIFFSLFSFLFFFPCFFFCLLPVSDRSPAQVASSDFGTSKTQSTRQDHAFVLRGHVM